MVNFDVEVSPDGQILYFVDGQFGPSGPQTADLVVAGRNGPGFERLPDSAALLQSVNSAALEYAAAISRDGLTPFFTRAGVGPNSEPAIFVASRASATSAFSAPERIAAIEGFVEGPSLSADERSLYYHRLSSGQFRIYRVHRPAELPALATRSGALLALLLGDFGSSWLLRSIGVSTPGANGWNGASTRAATASTAGATGSQTDGGRVDGSLAVVAGQRQA